MLFNQKFKNELKYSFKFKSFTVILSFIIGMISSCFIANFINFCHLTSQDKMGTILLIVSTISTILYFLLYIVNIIINKESINKTKTQIIDQIFNHSLEGITITDSKGKILDINPAFTQITGYTAQEAIGQNPNILRSNHHEENFYKKMWEELGKNGYWEGEIWNRRKNGDVYPEWLSIREIRDSNDNITHYVAVFYDLTEVKKSEQKLHFQTYHDALTGLPNRHLLYDRLSVSIAHAQRNKQKIGIIFIDLDHFKNINESMGFAVGDKLLRKAAQKMQEVIREADTIARMGGDEFVVLIEEMSSEQKVTQIAQRILDTFKTPMTAAGENFFLSPSLGIAFYPEDGNQASELAKNAETAMYQAKQKGRNTYCLFTPQMQKQLTQRVKLENNLRCALKNNEIHVYYQPKMDIASGQITGMEALVRWITKTGKIISPIEFIPLAEETGLIIPLGEHVLNLACEDTAKLIKQGFTTLKVAVNISAKQLQEKDLITQIISIQEYSGLASHNLELEITETSIMSNMEDNISCLEKIADKGISLAIDDFGTGYSSLAYLKHFPIKTLKIDRSFIKDMIQNEYDAGIVKTILAMARNFKLKAVAEGVEEQAQLDLLRSESCQEMQGYFLSPPLPFEQFKNLLEKHNAPLIEKN